MIVYIGKQMQGYKKPHYLLKCYDMYDMLKSILKGQLISKTNSQVEDSSKKRTNEFVFTSMQRVFVRFLGESSAS